MTYVAARVHISEDWNTKMIEIRGSIGVAPNNHTIIEYPFTTYRCGYMNRTKARKVAANVKQEVKAAAASLRLGLGIKLTQPVEMSNPWDR